MLRLEQKVRDALIQLLCGLLEAIHHELVGDDHLSSQLVNLLNLGRRQLHELLPIEGESLIDCAIHE